CLTIGAGRKGKITNYNSIVMVTSTDERLVKWLIKNFGGNFYKTSASGKCRAAYRWRFLKQKEIEILLLAVLPYLIIKREQAITLLDFVRLERTAPSEKRAALYQKMSLLNKRGADSV